MSGAGIKIRTRLSMSRRSEKRISGRSQVRSVLSRSAVKNDRLRENVRFFLARHDMLSERSLHFSTKMLSTTLSFLPS
jgi:hypothetical protein